MHTTHSILSQNIDILSAFFILALDFFLLYFAAFKLYYLIFSWLYVFKSYIPEMIMVANIYWELALPELMLGLFCELVYLISTITEVNTVTTSIS